MFRILVLLATVFMLASCGNEEAIQNSKLAGARSFQQDPIVVPDYFPKDFDGVWRGDGIEIKIEKEIRRSSSKNLRTGRVSHYESIKYVATVSGKYAELFRPKKVGIAEESSRRGKRTFRFDGNSFKKTVRVTNGRNIRGHVRVSGANRIEFDYLVDKDGQANLKAKILKVDGTPLVYQPIVLLISDGNASPTMKEVGVVDLRKVPKSTEDKN